MSGPILEANLVTRRYAAPGGGEAFALAPASLAVEGGTLVALTGRSGAGKTTLLHLLATLDRPDSGWVKLFGSDTRRLSDPALSRLRRRRIGILHQRFEFIERLPVWQNVTVRLVPEGTSARERRSRAAALLEELGVGHALDRPPGALSGGERQRVALARALSGAPALLFADEPTSHVDDATAALVLARLLALREGGVAIVTSSHDPAIVGSADRRYRLEGGVLAP